MVRLKRFIFSGVCASLALALFAPSAPAALITDFAGNYGTISPTGSTASSFDLGSTSITGSTPSGLAGSTGSAVTLNLSNVATATSGTLDLAKTGGGNTLTFNVPGGTVQFTFNPGFAFAITNILGTDFLNASGSIYVTGVTGTVDINDFGGQNRIYKFTTAITDSSGILGTTGTPGTLKFNGTPSASFSANITPDYQPAPPIPEPASMATLGLVGLIGGYAARRKLKAKAAARA